MGKCRDDNAGTFRICTESLEINAFQGDFLVQENKEVRSLSSAHHRFGYLLLFSSFLETLAVAAIRVPREARTLQFSKLIAKLWRV